MSTAVASTVGGKHLTFRLGDEVYGLNILRVQEIVGLLPVTRVPRLPSEIAGVVNLRGRVIPVVDLRAALEMPEVEHTDRTCIIIVRVVRGSRDTVMGLVVDAVSDVVDLPEDSVEAAPEFGIAIDTSFISGIGRIDDHVVLLLDIDRVMSKEQIGIAEEAAHACASSRDWEAKQ